MLDTLWQVLIGSLLVLAIVFLWILITALLAVAIKQWRRDHHG